MKIKDLYQIFLRHTTVFTDTRQISEGGLFFALKGANFDANTFASQALSMGASYAVIDDEKYWIDERTILVADVLSTLQDLARFHREQWNIPVIGLTGTNGKTTTKELIYSVLSEKYKAYATRGNLNNHIGVPLTILGKPTDSEIVIIEMGANHPEEIAFLCQIAQPTQGLITNIGKAHLEGFGGFEGVKKTKGELYEWLFAYQATVFIQHENEHLQQMRRKLMPNFNQIISYGTDLRCDIQGEIINNEPFLSVQWSKNTETYCLQTQLTGTYNFENILGAIAIGDFFKLSPSEIQRGIENYQPKNNRSQIQNIGNQLVICDYYNANPSSMMGALDNLYSFKQPNKYAILGDMFELGEESEQEHLYVIEKVKDLAIAKAIFIGKHFYQHKDKFPIYSFFKETADAQVFLESRAPFEPQVVLVKGSRGMKMEQLIQVFQA